MEFPENPEAGYIHRTMIEAELWLAAAKDS